MNNVLFTTQVINQEHQGTERLIKGDNWRNNTALDGWKHAVIVLVWGRLIQKVIKPQKYLVLVAVFCFFFFFSFLFGHTGPDSHLRPDFFTLPVAVQKVFSRIFTAKAV